MPRRNGHPSGQPVRANYTLHGSAFAAALALTLSKVWYPRNVAQASAVGVRKDWATCCAHADSQVWVHLDAVVGHPELGNALTGAHVKAQSAVWKHSGMSLHSMSAAPSKPRKSKASAHTCHVFRERPGSLRQLCPDRRRPPQARPTAQALAGCRSTQSGAR